MVGKCRAVPRRIRRVLERGIIFKEKECPYL